MPVDLQAWLVQTAVVLARVGAALVFVPLPGLRQSVASTRAALSVALALILTPASMATARADRVTSLEAAAWILPSEALLGIAAGLGVGWVLEAFTFGMQMISIQAGYSYASTIDPATQADSGVLVVAGQWAAGLTFISLGWEQQVLRAFAASLERAPPGQWQLKAELAPVLIQWTSTTVELAFRLALPAMAFLLLLDLTLALLGRTQPQLPLINLALPVKMAATLLLLAWQAQIVPAVMGRIAPPMLELLARLGIAG